MHNQLDKEVSFTCDLQEPIRLDKFLVLRLPEFSRSRLQNYIRDGKVLINQKPVNKGGVIIEKGDLIQISIPPTKDSSLVAEEIPIEILFENNDLIVINKSAGMVVHPAAGHATGTLVHAILNHVPDLEGVGGEHRPGIVHRLDKDTSGIILIAKNDRTHHFLQNQFRDRKVHKTYYALVDGFPPTNVGRIEAPIGRDPSHRKKMAIVQLQRGREAITEYKVIDKFPQHSLIAAHPLTGRTHQIRLHLSFLECPIVGDSVYGFRKATLPVKRHMLHAYQIEVTLPGEANPKLFTAPLPDDMDQILKTIKS